MSKFKIRNENHVQRVHDSFNRQGFMHFLGTELARVEPGLVEIRISHTDKLTQQHGYFHGGVIGTIADNASGYAAFSLMAASDSVLTVEFKLNLMAPAKGQVLIARGEVIRPGRRITTCRSDVFVVRNGEEFLCATMLGTFMTLANTPDEPIAGQD